VKIIKIDFLFVIFLKFRSMYQKLVRKGQTLFFLRLKKILGKKIHGRTKLPSRSPVSFRVIIIVWWKNPTENATGAKKHEMRNLSNYNNYKRKNSMLGDLQLDLFFARSGESRERKIKISTIFFQSTKVS